METQSLFYKSARQETIKAYKSNNKLNTFNIVVNVEKQLATTKRVSYLRYLQKQSKKQNIHHACCTYIYICVIITCIITTGIV